MRNSIIGAEYTNLPQLLENVVYHHLLYLGYEVYIGTLGEKEIDFVAVKDGEKKYFQVCYLLDKEDTREREF
ncbi:MAG: hypothetical protein LBG52_02165 [Candidatus Peribacteria bacterium]|jgi:predicted AAA+ superfamily ATPase|nr:hypothetical protein [Candidatus Peribacteria bacterium]